VNTITKSHNKKNKIILPIIVIIIIFLTSSYVYLYKLNGTFFGWSPIVDNSQTKTNNDTNDSIDRTNIDTDIQDQTINSSKNEHATEDTTSTANTNNIFISIPYAGLNTDNTTYRVTTLIDKVTSSGTCTLTLNKDNSIGLTQTAGVQASSSYSTCKGFSFSTENLSGDWTLTIKYIDGDITGIATKVITI